MKTTLALAALFILVLGGGYLWKGRESVVAEAPYNHTATTSATVLEVATTTSTNTTVTTSQTPGPATYTQAQVARHNTGTSCWATIGGNVYDLTKWIAQHPGGESPILGLCGKDGTSAFEGQHANSGRANAELATLKIGVVSK